MRLQRTPSGQNTLLVGPARCLLLAAALTLTGCGDSGSAAVGTMEVVAAVEALPDPYVVEGQTLTLETANLFVEAVEVLGGDDTAEHSHDDGHSHGEDEGGDASELVFRDTALDLTVPGEQIVGVAPDALAGEYTFVAVSLAPAEGGPSDGITLHVAGQAERNGETRTFEIRWVEEAVDFWIDADADIDLEANGEIEVPILIETEVLLAGLNFFAAGVDADAQNHVAVDAQTNAGMLSTVRTNLNNAMVLAVEGHSHDA